MSGDRFEWADNIRGIATISVVLLHIVAGILPFYGKIETNVWWSAHVLDSLVRYSVPAFLMLSGALLFSREESLGSFLKKRLTRVLYPFIFWTFVYLAYDVVRSIMSGHEWTIVSLCRHIYAKFQWGVTWHFWYVYLIVGLYLFFPIVGKWIRNSSKKEIRYFLILWFVVILINLPFVSPFRMNFNLYYFGGYLGYPILGYYLTLIEPKKYYKYISISLAFLGTLGTIYFTYLLTKNKGEFDQYYYEYLSPTVLVSALGIFWFLKDARIKFNPVRKSLKAIGEYSYGIYLGHILIIWQLDKFQLVFRENVIGAILSTFGVVAISLLLVYLIRKLPLGKYISG